MANIFDYKYIPILAISPAEMSAINELPEKDKDLLLPMFPLRGWSSSRLLSKTTVKINDVIGERPWIADIDADFLVRSEDEEAYPREVFYEVEKLLDPKNGYHNWYEFVNEIPSAIPTVQLVDVEELTTQLDKLVPLERGIVLRFNLFDINLGRYKQILSTVAQITKNEVLIIFDLGQISKNEVNPLNINNLSSVINVSSEIIPGANFAVSASSFPSSFSPFIRGENPIYERILFNKLRKNNEEINLIYSDRGSARAIKTGGGSGIPSPRIDYPLANDWRFVRRDFEDSKNVSKEEKVILYSQASRDVVNSEYWDESLKLWGTQLIELTSLEDDYGINNPNKATAVRINIHLHTQLFYDAPRDSFIDTDEDWMD